MTLKEKFATLTPEMREKCKEVKTAGELDSFLSQAGIELDAVEKKAALEYILTGALPLSDDELDTVAGGERVPTREEWERARLRKTFGR